MACQSSLEITMDAMVEDICGFEHQQHSERPQGHTALTHQTARPSEPTTSSPATPLWDCKPPSPSNHRQDVWQQALFVNSGQPCDSQLDDVAPAPSTPPLLFGLQQAAQMGMDMSKGQLPQESFGQWWRNKKLQAADDWSVLCWQPGCFQTTDTAFGRCIPLRVRCNSHNLHQCLPPCPPCICVLADWLPTAGPWCT